MRLIAIDRGKALKQIHELANDALETPGSWDYPDDLEATYEDSLKEIKELSKV
jgi:hypothetical protein